MKTYLVTGGAGFIGSNFVKYILREHPSQARVVIVDALTYAGNLDTLASCLHRPEVTFVKADICDSAAMEEIIDTHDPDYVVNFAAETHVDRSIDSPRVFLESNIMGTHTLLDILKRKWITPEGVKEGKKFLQIGTDEVYGALSRDYQSPKPLALEEKVKEVAAGRTDIPMTYGEGLFRETTPLSPHSPYSASKASADMLVLAYHDTYGLPVNITRCSNNYGPAQFPEKLIPLVINNLIEGRDIPVYGKGENVRDWLYVDDHCKAVDMVLRHGRIGQVYNIGGFNEKANIDIVKEIADTVTSLLDGGKYAALDKNKGPRRGRDLITYVTDRPGHDMRYAIDPEKIATELGWYPETTFTEGIKKTIIWYLDNMDWMKRITSGEYKNYYDKMYSDR